MPGGAEIAIDVKSTSGEFDRPLHASCAELIEMTGSRRYDIYRVYELTETSARISESVGQVASSILEHFHRLPTGVQVDSVSVSVAALKFGTDIRLSPASPEEIEHVEQAEY